MRAVAAQVERRLVVDLLDPDPLAPLGRAALRASLLWIGGVAVGSVSIVLTGGTPAEFAVLGFVLAVATGIFLIPVRGVHRRVLQAKRHELRRLRAEIARDRRAVRALGPDAGEAAQRLPGLLAYETRIESVREWPFDTPTLWRFLLYLSIPVASWLGGALVERLVDQLLD